MTDANTTKLASPITWTGDAHDGFLQLLDQRALPLSTQFIACRTASDVAEAIRSMVVRGAPAIGISAAMGFVMGVRDEQPIDQLCALLLATRPTAVNLAWALERMKAKHAELQTAGLAAAQVLSTLLDEACAIQTEDLAMNRKIGHHGAALIGSGAKILTHCNTGALATGGYGTALGVIRACHERAGSPGPNGHPMEDIFVWIDETRPYLQGARLTTYECLAENIPCALITDSMAGYFMGNGEVDAVIIGADRVAANGDTANKIGSYSLAVLANHHGIPFYVAAPSSTLDLSLASGSLIEIEERSAEEVSKVRSERIAPLGVSVRHPAFDITPGALVTAIITEHGVAQGDYVKTLPDIAFAGGKVVL